MEDHGPAKATHEEICDSALEHYEAVATECHHWSSTVPRAIEFFKTYGKYKAGNTTPGEQVQYCLGEIDRLHACIEEIGKQTQWEEKECPWLAKGHYAKVITDALGDVIEWQCPLCKKWFFS